MKFDHKYIKLLSTIGPRASLGLFLLEFIKKKKNLMVVTSDVWICICCILYVCVCVIADVWDVSIDVWMLVLTVGCLSCVHSEAWVGTSLRKGLH